MTHPSGSRCFGPQRSGSRRWFFTDNSRQAVARAITCSLAFASVLTLTGCQGPSVWQQGFNPETPAVVVQPATKDTDRASLLTTVRTREIPWDRMEQALAARRQALSQTDEPRERWSADQIERYSAEIARFLQAQDLSPTQVLGVSRILSTKIRRPDDAELATFGNQINATSAIWASRSAGTADEVSRETVFWDSYGPDWYYDGRGRTRRSAFPERQVGSVPVVVSREQFEVVVFWLR